MKPGLEALSLGDANVLVNRLRAAAESIEKIGEDAANRRRLRQFQGNKSSQIFDSILRELGENKTFLSIVSPALTLGAGLEMGGQLSKVNQEISRGELSAMREMRREGLRMNRLAEEAKGDGETARLAERQLLREEDHSQNRVLRLGNRAGRAGRLRARALSGRIDSMGATVEDRKDERSLRQETQVQAIVERESARVRLSL